MWVEFVFEFMEFTLASVEFTLLSFALEFVLMSGFVLEFMFGFVLDFAFILKVKGEAKFLSLSLSLSRLHCFESLSLGRLCQPKQKQPQGLKERFFS